MDTPIATFDGADLPGEVHPDPVFGSPAIVSAGWKVRWTASTGSTNDDLWRAGRAGAPDRLVLVADHQRAGRGRLDRRWDAPPGVNLLVSLLFRRPVADPHDLVRACALAAADASSAVAGVSVGLKWPNDLLVEDRKLAGILATAGPIDADGPAFVVVGIGLNVGWAPEGAARLVANPSSRTSVTPTTVLAALLESLDRVLALGVDERHATYRERLATIGRAVRVELADGTTVEGRATDVESDGRLVVLDSCGVSHRYDVGDVVHLR